MHHEIWHVLWRHGRRLKRIVRAVAVHVIHKFLYVLRERRQILDTEKHEMKIISLRKYFYLLKMLYSPLCKSHMGSFRQEKWRTLDSKSYFIDADETLWKYLFKKMK